MLIDADNSSGNGGSGNNNNNKAPYEWAALFQGDIQLPNAARNAVAGTNRRWPNAHIPYVISVNYSA